MCEDDSGASHIPSLRHGFEPAVEINLEPVESVVVTTLVDNVTDVFMPDQGPAVRAAHPRVITDLSAMNPQVVIPAHCTGWRAQHAMSAHFGDTYIPNAVGTRFYL